MAASFVAASVQSLNYTPSLITGAPFSVGFWFNVASVTPTAGIWALADTGGSGDHFELYHEGSALASYTNNNRLAFATALTANAWVYFVWRVISATNRRMSALFPAGVYEHVQATGSLTPGSIDSMKIGGALSSGGFDLGGRVAEFWYTNADIQADGAALFNSTLRQLAYEGPFRMMNLMGSHFHYRSFRRGLASDQDGLGDVFTKGAVPPTWTNTNATTIGPHVPLPQSYFRPDGAMTRALVV